MTCSNDNTTSAPLSPYDHDAVLQQNLTALAHVDNDLAQKLRALTLDDTVTLTPTRDGHVSFRITQPDGKRPWLGQTSVPWIAAHANAKRVEVATANVACLHIGHGAEAAVLLHKLAPYQALFIVEPDLRDLNLALRLHDFTTAITHHRLILLSGDNPADLLTNFYRQHLGFNLIEQTITSPWLTGRQNQQFSRQVSLAMEAAASHIFAAVQQQQQQLQTWQNDIGPDKISAAAQAPDYAALRITQYNHTHSLTHNAAIRDIMASFKSLNAQTFPDQLDQPDKVSHWAHLHHLNTVKPHAVVMIDRLRQDAGGIIPPTCPVLTWVKDTPPDIFHPNANPAQHIAPNDLILTSFHHQTKTLTDAGIPAGQIRHRGLAVNTDIFHPLPPEQVDPCYHCDTAVIADRTSTLAETYNIKLPTHQQLWETVLNDIITAPEKYYRSKAKRFLLRAQRCGVELQEQSVQDFFINLIEHCGGISALKDAYGLALHQAGIDLAIWSWDLIRDSQTQRFLDYWKESPICAQLRGVVDMGPRFSQCCNGAKIIIHISDTGRIDQPLLNALASGAFVLVRQPDDDTYDRDSVSRFYQLGKDLLTYDSAKDLVNKVRHYLAHDQQRRDIAQRSHARTLEQFPLDQYCRIF